MKLLRGVYVASLLSLVSCVAFAGEDVAPPSAAATPQGQFSDTWLGFRYLQRFSEPGIAKDIQRYVPSLSHSSSYRYGSNFFDVALNISDKTDPALNGTHGEQYAYINYRTQLQYGKVTGSPLSIGPLRDIALTAGFEWSTADNVNAGDKLALVLGPTFKFGLPNGFMDVTLGYYKERGHSSLPFAPKRDVYFDGTLQAVIGYATRFNALGIPAVFKGVISYNGTKGKNFFNVETAPELFTRQALMFDVGSQVFGVRNGLWAGLGYDYWRNKYGSRPGIGTKTSSPSINLEWHF